MSAVSKYLIYGLRDPRTNEIRYVGKSSSGLQRPRSHARAARSGSKFHVHRWIRMLKGAGFEYEIVVLESLGDECTSESLNEREIWWIAWYKPFGRLTNITKGGEGFDHDTARRASRIAQERSTPQQRLARGRAAIAAVFAKYTIEQRRSWARAASRVSATRMTLEQRRAIGRASAARLSPTQREARSRHAGLIAAAKLTSEQRSAINRKAWEKVRPEQRRAQALAANAKLTKEQRSDRARRANASLSPEERREIKRKAWATRRARAATKAAA